MNAGATLSAAVQRYLKERRQLGFELKAPATELMRFAHFADARGHTGPLTRELQIEWARQPVHSSSAVTAARRIEILRPFAAWHRQFEVDTEVLPTHALGRGHRRLTPHIYTDEEILQLLQHAEHLTPAGGLRPLTYRTLFGLLAAVGLRLSEGLKLCVGDVDLNNATLTVRQTKFHKSRCLPIHSSVVSALTAYRHLRDRHANTDHDAPFFVSTTGGFLSGSTVEDVFKRLRSKLGWHARGDHASPRLQDLRHTMVVRRVQRWHERGVSVDHAMFWLCTYLGHAKITDTYWYLTGVPELMAIVGSRFEHFALTGDNDE
ncbi:MAG: tyrosine-type recombinase/integrase [Burkholderiaceae bacterium]